MSKTIIINWKWAHLSEPSSTEVWNSENDEFKVICVNFEREEAFFEEDIPEIYEPANEDLYRLIASHLNSDELLLLAHKNPPHYFGEFDANWFGGKGVQVELFGGGEDAVYALSSPYGLLDQVGGFDREVIVDRKEKLLSSKLLKQLWAHYWQKGNNIKEKALIFSRELLPYLLEGNSEPIPVSLQEDALKLKAIAEKDGDKQNLPALLAKIALGDKRVNLESLSKAFEVWIYAS